jgi:hypothetical protein
MTRLYACLYKGRKLLLEADSSYAAQQEAARRFRARRAWDVIVYLADEPMSAAAL